ncbi:MAG TPA: nodulation protein NfeD [Thermomicrobiales bacterium]|nr:nodulation protein NfeD [Thermomicrobiales bacterium]
MSQPPVAIPGYIVLFRLLPVLCMLAGMAMLALSPTSAQDELPEVRVLDIDDTITPAMAQYIERGIASAENANVDAIVIEIDTPGGLSSAMDDIDRAILESEVPVIAWVSPRGARAASAGVFITYASHIAAMAPGTSIGSASPVSGDGSDMSDTMEAKVTNDAVSNIRNLANLRGRNADWAESAVRDAANITADEALDLNVINLIAADLPTLLNEVDGMQVTMADGSAWTLTTAGAETSTTSMNVFEELLQFISNPTIAYLLMSFGALGIFLELSNPGTFIPGIVGVISLVLGLYALGAIPVNWTGVLLIAIAFGLFFLDLFVTSFGILLVAGLSLFIIGSYMLVDTSVPGFEGVAPFVIWTSAALIAATALIIGGAVLRSMRSKPSTGAPSLVGEIGVVRRPLDPTGMVHLQGELWTATAEGMQPGDPSIPVGANVEVTAIHGLRLVVQPSISAPDVPPATVARSRGEGVIPVVGGVRDARLSEMHGHDTP